MRQRLFASRAAAALTAALTSATCLTLGLALAHHVRTRSADVGVDLVLFVAWLVVALGAAASQVVLVGSLLWGERWRRRAVCGWRPSEGESEPSDIRDRRAPVGLLLVACVGVTLAATEAATGGFVDWYERLGFAIVQSRSADARLRLEAVVSLAEEEDPAAEAVVVAGVLDEEPTIRARAVWIAGERRLLAALPGLLETVEAPEEELRAVAAEALGKLGGPEARDTLVDLLARADTPELQRATLAGIGLLGDPALRERVAGELATARDERVWAAAVWALGELGDTSYVSALLEIAPFALLRCAAVHALARAHDGRPAALPPALRAAFPPARGTQGDRCPLEWITPAARDHCTPRQVRTLGVPYEGECNRYLLSSPEPYRLKLVRAMARVGGPRASDWLAAVYDDEGEEPLVRTRARELHVRLAEVTP